MDKGASQAFLDQSLERLQQAKLQLGAEIKVEDLRIFVLLPSSRFNRKFLLAITIIDGYPETPADYRFLNPLTKADEGVANWPNDGGQAFKLENPPWICMEGTRGWVQHNHPNPGVQRNLIENVVFSIFAKLNKTG